jgi:hypothetical protein
MESTPLPKGWTTFSPRDSGAAGPTREAALDEAMRICRRSTGGFRFRSRDTNVTNVRDQAESDKHHPRTCQLECQLQVDFSGSRSASYAHRNAILRRQLQRFLLLHRPLRKEQEENMLSRKKTCSSRLFLNRRCLPEGLVLRLHKATVEQLDREA